MKKAERTLLEREQIGCTHKSFSFYIALVRISIHQTLLYFLFVYMVTITP